MKAGDPVELDDLLEHGHRPAAVVQQATDRIMAALTALVAELRGEQPPAERFDPRKAGVRPHRQPEEAAEAWKGCAMTQGRGVRCRVVGDGVLDRAGRRRQRRHHLGSPRGGVRDASTTAARTPTTCPGSSCPASITATHDPEQVAAGADVVVLAVPSQTLREQPHRLGPGAAAARPCWSR